MPYDQDRTGVSIDARSRRLKCNLVFVVVLSPIGCIASINGNEIEGSLVKGPFIDNGGSSVLHFNMVGEQEDEKAIQEIASLKKLIFCSEKNPTILAPERKVQHAFESGVSIRIAPVELRNLSHTLIVDGFPIVFVTLLISS